MSSEEIERLKDKVEKDPNSKLFVPLAEEYKKEGMYDEAIDVLIRGIERQPNYLSAHVSLAKIYIEKEMLLEARDEFEKVINVIPDNLYAHKKLAEIYKDLGEKEKAIYELKTVLSLNPSDEWAEANLSEIEHMNIHEGPREAAEITVEEQAPSDAEQTIGKGEDPVLSIPEDEGLPGEWEQFQPVDFSEEQQQADTPPEHDIPHEWTQGQSIHLEEIEEKEEEEEEMNNLWEVPFDEDEEIAEIREGSPQETVEETGVSRENTVETSPGSDIKMTEQGITDADTFIIKGNYAEALNIYRSLLEENPDDKEIIQRVEELKALLQLLGKDKEALIKKLEQLREGFNKRKNEFH